MVLLCAEWRNRMAVVSVSARNFWTPDVNFVKNEMKFFYDRLILAASLRPFVCSRCCLHYLLLLERCLTF